MQKKKNVENICDTLCRVLRWLNIKAYKDKL